MLREKTRALSEGYFSGFDYVRAVGALFVLAIHSHVPFAFTNYWPGYARPGAGDVFLYNVLYLAVPCFFLVSLFLLFIKSMDDPAYGVRRLGYLFSLYVFWSAVFLAYGFLMALAQGNMEGFTMPFEHTRGIITIIFTGGGWLYFFFFSLMAMTAVMLLYMRLIRKAGGVGPVASAALFAASLLAVQALPFISTRVPLQLDYWNPLGFLPYVFAVPVLVHVSGDARRTATALLALVPLSVLFAVLEWRMVHYYHIQVWTAVRNLMPPYARVSVALGSTAVVLMAMYVKRSAPRAIRFLSRYSLGIYCLHAYAPLNKIILALAHGGQVALGNYVLFFSRLADSALMTAVFMRVPWLSRFVGRQARAAGGDATGSSPS